MKSFVGALLSLNLILHIKSSQAGKLAKNDPNPCEGLPTDTFVPNPKGCKYMFHCRNGNPFEAFCPGEFWFNPDSGICDFRSNVDCHLDDAKPNSKPNELILCPLKDTKEIKFIASSIDCGRFYICYHGKPVQQQCIGDLHWNDEKKKCDYEKQANCKIASDTPQCPSNGQVFFAHPTQCNYFVFCHNGFATIQQCPFYHHWDSATEECKWRTLARCASRQ